MRTIAKLLSILCVAALGFVACNNDPAPSTKSVVTLSHTEISADAKGGSYEVFYTVANPVEGAMLTVECEADWISDISVETKSITFVVASYSGIEVREATLEVLYPNAEASTIRVMQFVNSAPNSDAFAISVQEVHASSAITQVVPKDGDMYYVMYLEEVSYLQSGDIDTAEKLWEDDYVAFEGGAVSNNMNLKEYMLQSQLLFKGTNRVQWNSLLPGVKSVLYIYGVLFNEDGAYYEPVTDIAWCIIEPERAPLRDITFDLDVEVSGADIKLDIKPNGWDGYYLVKIVDVNNDLYVSGEDIFTDEYMAQLATEWVNVNDANLGYGYSQSYILENICFTGEQLLDYELSSYVLYSALVYAVDEHDGFVQVVSQPSYINFSTEQVQQADLDINIEITNCYVRVADLRVVPSDPNCQYLLLITPTSYLPSNYDDETLISLALGDFSWYTQTFKGEITSHLNTLYPDMEYIAYAFGYSGGVVTTDVCSTIFTTEPEGKCEIEVTDVVIGGPYLPSELNSYDPERFKYFVPPYCYDSSFFVISLEVQTSEPTPDIFSDLVAKMDYDYYGEDTIFYDLLISTCSPLEITAELYEYAPYYVCAAAFDYKGNVTPMWRSNTINWTSADIKSIDELIEKLEASPNMQLLGVSRDGKVVPIRR